MKPTVSLRAAAEIYEQRSLVYGDNYKQFGGWVSKLFPLGVRLVTEEDHNRFGVLIQVMSKLSRYCQNFETGGHDDSLDDLAVYAMMLKELDGEARVTRSAAIDPIWDAPPASHHVTSVSGNSNFISDRGDV